MPQPLKVRILGRDYPLRVQASDVETMRNVAQDVDQRMQAFKNQNRGEPDLVAAVITALQLAEELLGAKEASDALVTALDRETDHLDHILAEVLEEIDPASIQE
ncbi:MAG: cell division protein ZapA [Bacteroidetes bacterium]|nr:cell division protein ZapA [Bacteroidota bacterium]